MGANNDELNKMLADRKKKMEELEKKLAEDKKSALPITSPDDNAVPEEKLPAKKPPPPPPNKPVNTVVAPQAALTTQAPPPILKKPGTPPPGDKNVTFAPPTTQAAPTTQQAAAPTGISPGIAAMQNKIGSQISATASPSTPTPSTPGSSPAAAKTPTTAPAAAAPQPTTAPATTAPAIAAKGVTDESWTKLTTALIKTVDAKIFTVTETPNKVEFAKISDPKQTITVERNNDEVSAGFSEEWFDKFDPTKGIDPALQSWVNSFMAGLANLPAGSTITVSRFEKSPEFAKHLYSLVEKNKGNFTVEYDASTKAAVDAAKPSGSGIKPD